MLNDGRQEILSHSWISRIGNEPAHFWAETIQENQPKTDPIWISRWFMVTDGVCDQINIVHDSGGSVVRSVSAVVRTKQERLIRFATAYWTCKLRLAHGSIFEHGGATAVNYALLWAAGGLTLPNLCCFYQMGLSDCCTLI